MAKQFMEENGINWWTVWPSESPDINPIEMVWNQMKRNKSFFDEWKKVVSQNALGEKLSPLCHQKL
jgi:transposase